MDGNTHLPIRAMLAPFKPSGEEIQRRQVLAHRMVPPLSFQVHFIFTSSGEVSSRLVETSFL